MGAKDEDLPLAKPGEDPYHIEWPDDSKEMRTAERERAAKAAAIIPAPRALTAATIGIGVVLVFVTAITVIAGSLITLVWLALPIILAGVLFALPLGLLLERVSQTWRKGLPEMAFLAAGLVIGITWTHGAIAAMETLMGQSVADNPGDAVFIRSASGAFMGTAVATAFLCAKFWTEPFRRQPRLVFAATATIALLGVMSALLYVGVA